MSSMRSWGTNKTLIWNEGIEKNRVFCCCCCCCCCCCFVLFFGPNLIFTFYGLPQGQYSIESNQVFKIKHFALFLFACLFLIAAVTNHIRHARVFSCLHCESNTIIVNFQQHAGALRNMSQLSWSISHAKSHSWQSCWIGKKSLWTTFDVNFLYFLWLYSVKNSSDTVFLIIKAWT